MWSNIREVVQYSAAASSILTNLFLVLLISYKSPVEIGNYKYLLQCISLFEMMYGVLDIVASPITYSVGSTFLVIVPHKFFGPHLAVFFNCLYCAFFGFSMGMFVVIFAYRLLASTGNSILNFLDGRKILFVFMFPLFYSLVWFLIALFPFAPSPEKDDHIRLTISTRLGLNLSEISYTGPFYYSSIRQQLIVSSILSTSTQLILTALSLFLVAWFGMRCYLCITHLLKKQQTMSRRMQDLQRQLFLALVLQATIPVVLMHIPVIGLYIFSLLSWNFNPILVCIAISLFPALDPFPTIFVIKGYRIACFGDYQADTLQLCPSSFQSSSKTFSTYCALANSQQRCLQMFEVFHLLYDLQKLF